MARSQRAIHQVLHGYNRGHRLLAGSTDLPDEFASIISRASDAAPNYRPSSGPYLTGYGLPDGSWALGRTWPDADADRPNTVLTHTLLVPSPIVGQLTAGALVPKFRFPDPAIGYDAFRAPIALAELSGGPTKTTPRAAHAGAAAYWQDKVIVHGLTSEERESLALALWDQHWMPIRRTLNFCTAPDAFLFESRHHSLLFSDRSSSPENPSAMPSIVVEDLCGRTEFRDWLHFVGSGERNTTLVDTFADVYLLLRTPGPSAPAIRKAESLLARAGPGLGELRRLKRRLLSFERDRPRWSVAPDLVLKALVHERLGGMTLAADASLEEWIACAWRADPTSTTHLLVEARTHESVEEIETSYRPDERSARDEIALTHALDRLLTPATLPLAAELSPERILTLLIERADPELWRAWANLSDGVHRASLAPHPPPPADWTAAITGVRDEPDALRLLLAAYPAATHVLIDALATTSHFRDSQLHPLPRPATRVVQKHAETATSPRQIRAVSYLIDPSHLPKKIRWHSWISAVRTDRDDLVATVAYLLGRRTQDELGLELAATAIAHLYPVLARSSAPRVWDRLNATLSGDRGSWDRCRRLSDDYAMVLDKQSDATVARMIGVIRRGHPPTARAVANAMRHKRPESLWKALTDLLPW